MIEPAPLQVVDALSVAWAKRGWLVIAAFVLASVVEYAGADREWTRRLHAGTWLFFAVFWGSMIPYFIFEQKSIVEGVGAIVGVPLSAAVAYHVVAGRDSLFVLSRAVAIMGLIYFPVAAVEAIQRPLIEIVTDQTAWLMQTVGFDPRVVDGMTVDGYQIAKKTQPYESTFVFDGPDDRPITYTIVMACTGIGSMAIFGGLIGAVSAPWRRKLKALAVSIPVIYGLNIIRNVFIGVGFGEQYFQIAPGTVMWLFGLDSPVMVSYIVSDRLIAQFLSVIALIVITWLVVRELPEVLVMIEDVIYLATGRELDLRAALGVDESGPAAAA
jgi:archaeosortase A (PGF-CTERM-specific)